LCCHHDIKSQPQLPINSDGWWKTGPISAKGCGTNPGLDLSQRCAEYYLKGGTQPCPSGISVYTNTVQAAWIKCLSLTVVPSGLF